MGVRYFITTMPDGTAVTLFRLDTTKPDAITEGVFRGGVAWASDTENKVVETLVTGSNDLDEIDEAKARELFPAAFA